MNFVQSSTIAVLLFLIVSNSHSAEAENLGPFVLPNTSQHVLHSTSIDEDFLISVSMPPSYSASNEDFPIVYLVDANSLFATAASNIRLLQGAGSLPQFILVGIGYDLRDKNPLDYLTLRYRDMTHVSDPEIERRLAANPPPFNLPEGAETGEIESFISFFENEVVGFIAENYRANTEHQTIVGHSLGGNFALYALLQHPALFNNYVIGSPGLFWGEFSLLELEQSRAEENRILDKRVFVSVGDQEDAFDFDNSIKQIVSTRELYNRLNSNHYENIEAGFKLFEGHNHISVIPETITRGLMTVFSD